MNAPNIDITVMLIIFGACCAGLGWLLVEGLIWLFSFVEVSISLRDS